MTTPQYAVEEDGLTHINVYTRGATPLGRRMSNLADIHIEHPHYGHFRTLEGLWYFLKTGKDDDLFRVLAGYDAKRHGRDKPMVWDQNFQYEFKIGIICKILASDELQTMLSLSTMPFVHYYFYGKVPGKQKLVIPKGHEWQMEFWDCMRQHLKAGRDLRVVLEEFMKTDTDDKKSATH